MEIELFAGLPVSDLGRAREWCARLLGDVEYFDPNDTERVWTLAEHRHLQGHLSRSGRERGRSRRGAGERGLNPRAGLPKPLTDGAPDGTILRVSQPVVDIRGLHVRFGEVQAVAGLRVPA